MVVADSIHVVITRDVKGYAILVEHRVSAGVFRGEPATRNTVEVQPNIYRVTRIELEETPKRPTAQRMASEALLRLKERQFIGYI